MTKHIDSMNRHLCIVYQQNKVGLGVRCSLKRRRERKGGGSAVLVNNRWCYPQHVTISYKDMEFTFGINKVFQNFYVVL